MKPIPALLAVAALAALRADPPPKDVGLVERATTRLAQIDVSVTGPPDVVSSLTKEDFTVSVNFRKLREFTLDRVCRDEVAAAAGAISADAGRKVAEAPVPGAPTFVFYLDHVHLTMAGRQNAIDTLRELIPKLITAGARGSILSNATEFYTDAPFTTDPGELLAALDRIENDRTRFDPWSTQETARLAEVMRLLGQAPISRSDDNVVRAIWTARRFQMDERWRAERDLRRIEMVLARLADTPPPKAFLYFADTMRQNAGEHYLSFFGKAAEMIPSTPLESMRNDSDMAGLPFARVLDQAASNGIRFYTIEGEGMASPGLGIESRNSADSLQSISDPGLNLQRVHDAQDSMAALALETGGEAFLNGSPPRRIAAHVLDDLRCFYLISFDPADFPRDAPLRVSVQVDRPRVALQVRGRLVIPSESERLKARLLASLAAPDLAESDVPIRVGVIPVGYRDGAFRARVQVAVAGVPTADATWDLGASLVSRGRVRDDASRRVEVPRPNTPVVLEEEMSFGPGPYELVALAHESTTDLTSSTKVEGSFPDPKGDPAAVGPISVLQPAKGAFVRDGDGKSSGNLVAGAGDPLRPDLPTALLGIVCVGDEAKGTVRVERTLVGEEETPFPEQGLDLGTEPCGQILDVIPENTLGPGRYRYLVRVMDAKGEIARGERAFLAAGSGASK